MTEETIAQRLQRFVRDSEPPLITLFEEEWDELCKELDQTHVKPVRLEELIEKIDAPKFMGVKVLVVK